MENEYDSNFGRCNNQYLLECIKLADAKASLLLVIEGGFLFKIADGWWEIARFIKTDTQPSIPLNFYVISLALATFLLLVSVVAALLVIFPREGEKDKKGYIFWENVADFPNAKTYAAEVIDIPKEKLDLLVLEQNYHLSVTAKRKYKVLRRAFIIGSIALVISIFVIGFFLGN